MKTVKTLGMVAVALVALPLAATAQMGGGDGHLASEQVGDLATVADKFVQLAEAFPEDTYDWRPMEGVRSVRDVMALMVAEFYLFPGIWGVSAPHGVPSGFGPAIQHYAEMSKDELVAELRTASEFFMGTIDGMSDGDRAADANWFGRTVSTESAILLAGGDMHEHLGQAIAYARTNRVVPPWSN